MSKFLTKQNIRNAQKEWGDGIIKIGKAYTNKEDYKSLTKEFINHYYGYKEGLVLFKPTLASIEQFRETFEKALSYFIAGNPDFPEDQGFALRPWIKVKFQDLIAAA